MGVVVTIIRPSQVIDPSTRMSRLPRKRHNSASAGRGQPGSPIVDATRTFETSHGETTEPCADARTGAIIHAMNIHLHAKRRRAGCPVGPGVLRALPCRARFLTLAGQHR